MHDAGSPPRVLSDPGFPDDVGGADAALDAVLARWSAAGPAEPVLTALLDARVLVPIVAILSARDDASGAEKATDMAVVTLRGDDGRVALPAFTSIERLSGWHPEARPLPITAVRAAQAALFENADLLVLDPAGPVPFLVEGRALRALAEGRVPVPPVQDPEVAAAVRARLATEPAVAAAVLVGCADPSGPDVTLALVLDVTRCPDPAACLHALSADLAADPVLRDRLSRGLDLALVPEAALPGGVLLVGEPRGAADC